jgi:hypothetical protein
MIIIFRFGNVFVSAMARSWCLSSTTITDSALYKHAESFRLKRWRILVRIGGELDSANKRSISRLRLSVKLQTYGNAFANPFAGVVFIVYEAIDEYISWSPLML